MDIAKDTKIAIKFQKKNQFTKEHGLGLINDALQFELAGKYRESLQILRKAQNIFKSIGDKKNQVFSWNLLHGLFVKIGKKKEALECLKKVVSIRRKMKNNYLTNLSFDSYIRGSQNFFYQQVEKEIIHFQNKKKVKYFKFQEVLQKKKGKKFNEIILKGRNAGGPIHIKVLYNHKPAIPIDDKAIKLQKSSLPVEKLSLHPNVKSEIVRFIDNTPFFELSKISSEFSKDNKEGVNEKCGFIVNLTYKNNLGFYINELKKGEHLFNDELPFLNFMRGLLSGIKHINRSKIVHFNIRPETIILDNNNNPVISSFEMSRETNNFLFSPEKENPKKENSPYLPPELFEKTTEPIDCSKVDSYSAGVVFYEMITKSNKLFNEDGEYKEIFSSLFSSRLLGIIRRLVDKDFSKRSTISSALKNIKEMCCDIQNREFRVFENNIEKSSRKTMDMDKKMSKGKEGISIMEHIFQQQITNLRQTHFKYECELRMKDKLIKEMADLLQNDSLEEIRTRREIYKREVENLGEWVKEERMKSSTITPPMENKK